MPVDMRSVTDPTELIVFPVSPISHCISDAARQARCSCPSLEKKRSRASPRNLSTSPPRRSATPIRPSKTPETASTSSSAPARPFACRRSDRRVKPDRSTETSVPSSSRGPTPPSHSRTRRGRYGSKDTPEFSLVGLETSRAQSYRRAQLGVWGRVVRGFLLRPALIGVVALGVAAVLPGVAWAGNGGSYTARAVSTPPTVDGVITGPEWSSASTYPLSFNNGAIAADVRFVHTATDLYVGMVIHYATPGTNVAGSVVFDNNNDGQSAAGDESWHEFKTSGPEDFFYAPTGAGGGTSPGFYNDFLNNGHNDTTGAVGVAGGAVTIEIKHPLCNTNDVGTDICLHTGDTAGVNFEFEPDPTNSGTHYEAPGTS